MARPYRVLARATGPQAPRLEGPMHGTPRLRGLASRVAARVMASRFAGPIARVALVGAGLSFLALLGHVGLAGAFGSSPLAATLAPAPAPASAPASAPAPAPAS